MNITEIGYNILGIYQRTQTTGTVKNGSFAGALEETKGTGVRAATHSTVDDYVKKHPENRDQIDRLLNPGRKVMEQYGLPDAVVEEMSMDEYKNYIYGILDRIPFDSSQMRDIQFIDITEQGWEQMKNDPKYEAWVVGYFKVDRSVTIPFANYPGVEPCIHTEHFGATIDEHLGQSYPQSMRTGKEKNSEDWWEKRRKRHKLYMEQLKEHQEKERLANKELLNQALIRTLAEGSQNTYFDFEAGTEGSAADFFRMMAAMSGSAAMLEAQ